MDDKIEKFQIDVTKLNIKEAGSEESVSKTINELLELNKLIPARTNKEIHEVQEAQLADTDNRWEEDSITEKQLQKNDKKEMVAQELDPHIDNLGITEKRLNDTKFNRNEKAWDTSDDPFIRGHKDVAPIWKEVYTKEDERKKTNKGQMDKKKKK